MDSKPSEKPVVPESIKKATEELIPAPKKPEGPSDSSIKAAQELLFEAVKAGKNVKEGLNTLAREARKAAIPADFGYGKPGRIEFDVPEIPRHLGYVTVSLSEVVKEKDGTPKLGDKGQKLYTNRVVHYTPGSKHMLTMDEIHEIEWRMSRLVYNEVVGKHGEGRAKKVEANLSLGGGNRLLNNTGDMF